MADANEPGSPATELPVEVLLANTRRLMIAAQRQREALADQNMVLQADNDGLRQALQEVSDAARAAGEQLEAKSAEVEGLTRRLQEAHDGLSAQKRALVAVPRTPRAIG